MSKEQKSNLIVHYYKYPASFRMVLINQDILAIGWYNYHSNEVDSYGKQTISVRGHDTPGILCYSGSKEYDIFIKEVNIAEKKLADDSIPVELLT